MTGNLFLDLLIPLVFTWLVVGCFIWVNMNRDEILDEGNMSIGQLILVRLLSGPGVWIMSVCQVVWLILGYLGPRTGRRS